MMKMVEKTDEENHHFSWCCFLLQSPFLFFLVTLVTFLALLYFLSSHGSSHLVTIAILFISTFVFFLRFFKKKTRFCLAEPSQKQDDDDTANDDADADNVDDEADDEEVDIDDEDGLIEIALVSEEGEAIEAMRNIYQSPQSFRVDEDEEDDIDDVNMEDDNLIEIDISIGSIKRLSK